MATKITDLTALGTTPTNTDVLHIVDVGDDTGGAAGTSKKITVSNLLASAGAVDSVNGQTGVVSLGVQDLDDVAGGTPSTGDVISYTAGTWVLNSGLQTLLARFKASGTGAQVYDTLNDTSKGYVDIQATSAKIGLAETTIDISQTSPGAMTFGVAAGGAGVETQYNAAFLNGQTTAGSAHLLLKSGTEFRLENAGGYETWLRQNPSAAANITVGLPATAGTLALTTDIPSAGIAAVVDDTSPQLGGNLDVNGFDIESNGDVIVQIDADNNTPLAKFAIKNGAGSTIYTIDEEGTTLATTGASNDVKIGNLDGSLGTFNGISLNGNLTYPGIVGFAGGSSASDNFFLFGEVIDIRAGGASDASMRIVEDSATGEAQVVINKAFPSPTTHTLYVGGNGKFDGQLDCAGILDAVNIKVNGAQGTNGQVLTSTGSGVGWASVGGSGTVTSVAMSVPSAFAISGSPITTSGTLALSVGGTAAQYIDGTGALQTLPQGVTSVSGTAPIVVTGTNTPTVSITAATTSAAGSMSAADKTTLNSLASAYEETELVTGQNTLMLTSVSVASNKIVDIMGDALADTSNANSKKFIGFHTGSGDCVLQGMVDAVSAISGATAGSPLWIGASGVFSSAAPTTANYYSRVVGYFVGTGQGGEVICYFDPSKDWVQIS